MVLSKLSQLNSRRRYTAPGGTRRAKSLGGWTSSLEPICSRWRPHTKECGNISILITFKLFGRSKRMPFHLNQNIWRKVQEFGLQADYVQDEALALPIRLLAFASPLDVLKFFPQIISQLAIPQAQDLLSTLSYVCGAQASRWNVCGTS